MIQNAIGFVYLVTEIIDQAKNFPNAPRIITETSSNRHSLNINAYK